MKNKIISVISIMAGIFFVGCDVNNLEEKVEKDNELLGWWKEIMDTVSAEGREYFWVNDSTKEAGGFWDHLDLTGFFNDDHCMIDGYFRYKKYSDTLWLIYTGGDYRYKICSDTLWLIHTGGDFKDTNGVIVSHDDPDTSVVRYYLSESKDTLYFEKIDHPQSRYLPNYTREGDLFN